MQDESDKLPFPNTQSDFHLPGEFSDLLEERLKPEVKEEKEEKEIRARGRPPKKDKDKDKDKDKEKDNDTKEEGKFNILLCLYTGMSMRIPKY